MKKILFLLAFLPFIACQKDATKIDEPESGLKQLQIHITQAGLPGERGIEAAASEELDVKDITLMVTGTFKDETTPEDGSVISAGYRYKTFEKTADKSALELAQAFTFNNIKSITKVEVLINTNGPVMESTSAEQFAKGLAVSAYGATSQYSLKKGSVDTYIANVTTAIPVARLEIGALEVTKRTTSSEPNSDKLLFSAINFSGLFLNNYINNGSITTGTNSATDNLIKTTPEADALNTAYLTSLTTSNALHILFDPSVSALDATAYKANALEPADSQVYAYNFFVDGTTSPEVIVAFDGCLYNPVFAGTSGVKFVRITKFLNDADPAEPIIPQAGNVYRITKISIPEDKIIDASEQYINLQVTVTVAKWTLNDIASVEFGENLN